MRFWEKPDMVIELPLVRLTAAPPLRTRLVLSPPELSAIVPLLVMVPVRVVVVPSGVETVLPALIVRPLSVLLLLYIAPPAVVVSVPPLIVLAPSPARLTIEPEP